MSPKNMKSNMGMSSLNRALHVSKMKNENFDVLIFGGGITGAGIALDAASRGLKVALIELNDFASGTSSRSTKLIHGGLRYLEKLQFKFVAQLGKERKILHQNAAHNIIPTPVLLPIIKGGQLNKTLTYLGLKVYDFLAGVKNEYKTRWITKQDLLAKYDTIEQTGLKGAFRYNEYKANDGRLVIETLKKACDLGAVCLNFIQTEQLVYNNGEVCGANVIDTMGNTAFAIKAKHLVNASGPWSEIFLNAFDKGMAKTLYPTKGVHFVVSKERFPINEAFYFDTHDERMIFAIPRQEFVYVGTTDTFYAEDIGNPRANKNDIDYLLTVVNNKFSKLELSQNDLISVWAGIRPLLQEPDKKPGEISRKDELLVSESKLITIVGGKLTGYRLMAKKVVDSILRDANKPFVKCFTHQIRLSGSNWEKPPQLHELVEINDRKYDEAKQAGISPVEFKRLFYRYGTNIDKITEQAYAYKGVASNTEEAWLKAEIWYSVNHEMLSDLLGFFAFRTEMVLFELDKINKHLTFVSNCLAEFLKWDEAEKTNQIKQFKQQWEQYQIPKSK